MIMPSFHPYLHFNGNAEEAFKFYQSVFGGEFTMMQRFGDVPPEAAKGLSDTEKNKIMHIALPIGKEGMLMGGDTPEKMGKVTFGTNFSISVDTKSEQETKKIFDGLSADGKVIMPLEKTFWNAYFGMCVDKFGVSWMVNYSYDQGSKLVNV